MELGKYNTLKYCIQLFLEILKGLRLFDNFEIWSELWVIQDSENQMCLITLPTFFVVKLAKLSQFIYNCLLIVFLLLVFYKKRADVDKGHFSLF